MSEIATEAVPNQFIVSFKRYTPEEVFLEHIRWAQAAHAEAAAQRAESEEPVLTGVGRVFAFPYWYGYVGGFDETLKAEIEARDEVSLVEPDYIVKVDANEMQDLVYVSSIHKPPVSPVNHTYIEGNTAGEGTTAYVLDTGIMTDHDDFGGRAEWGMNFVDSSDTDGHGHGTHVARTIGGADYGVAKKTALVAVKVVGDDGYGPTSGVIAGIEWAVNDAIYSKKLDKSVANLSLTSPRSRALNDAVASAINAGLFVAAIATGPALQKKVERMQMLLNEESERSRKGIGELREMAKAESEKVWTPREEQRLMEHFMSKATTFAWTLRNPGEGLAKSVRTGRRGRNGSGLWNIANRRHQPPRMVQNDRSFNSRRHVTSRTVPLRLGSNYDGGLPVGP